MAYQFRISNSAAKRLADAFDDEVAIGSTAPVMDIREGTQPADPDTAATGTLLGTITFDDPMFGAATDANPGGLLTATGVPKSDSSADANGTAGYFRIRATGTGADDVADGTCGTATTDLVFNTVSVQISAAITVTSFTVTMKETEA